VAVVYNINHNTSVAVTIHPLQSQYIRCSHNTSVAVTCVVNSSFPSSNDDTISSHLFYDPVSISSSISCVA